MNIATILVLAVLVAAAALAARYVHKKRSAGGCSGSCGSCAGGCPHAQK